jgi:hypothetical protein
VVYTTVDWLTCSFLHWRANVCRSFCFLSKVGLSPNHRLFKISIDTLEKSWYVYPLASIIQACIKYEVRPEPTHKPILGTNTLAYFGGRVSLPWNTVVMPLTSLSQNWHWLIFPGFSTTFVIFTPGVLPPLLRRLVRPQAEVQLHRMDGRQGHSGRRRRQIQLPEVPRKGLDYCYLIYRLWIIYIVLSIDYKLFIYYITLMYVMMCYVMLFCVILCYVMLCYFMLCYVTLHYITLCYIMLCYFMLRYVM